jgi:hypothetical protein
VDWRLGVTNGLLQIKDVAIDGVSMALAQRSQIAALIARAGGQFGMVLAANARRGLRKRQMEWRDIWYDTKATGGRHTERDEALFGRRRSRAAGRRLAPPKRYARRFHHR